MRKAKYFFRSLLVFSTILTVCAFFLRAYGREKISWFAANEEKFFILMMKSPWLALAPTLSLLAFSCLFIRYKKKRTYAFCGLAYLLSGIAGALIAVMTVTDKQAVTVLEGSVLLLVAAILAIIGGLGYLISGIEICNLNLNMSDYNLIQLQAVNYLYENRMLSYKEHHDLEHEILSEYQPSITFFKVAFVIITVLSAAALFLPLSKGDDYFKTTLVYSIIDNKAYIAFAVPVFAIIGCILCGAGKTPFPRALAIGFFLSSTVISLSWIFVYGALRGEFGGIVFAAATGLMFLMSLIYGLVLLVDYRKHFIDPIYLEGELKYLFEQLKVGEVKEKDYAPKREKILEVFSK